MRRSGLIVTALFAVTAVGAGPLPAAIFVHGGGFDEASKSTNVRPLFEPLANAWFAWFSVDYRMAPEFRFPQAARWNIDKTYSVVPQHGQVGFECR